MEEQVFDVTKQLNELCTRDLAGWYYRLLKMQFISLVISRFRKKYVQNSFTARTHPESLRQETSGRLWSL